jgi:hypothetical protein
MMLRDPCHPRFSKGRHAGDRRNQRIVALHEAERHGRREDHTLVGEERLVERRAHERREIDQIRPRGGGRAQKEHLVGQVVLSSMLDKTKALAALEMAEDEYDEMLKAFVELAEEQLQGLESALASGNDTELGNWRIP